MESTVRTDPKYNWKISETGKYDTSNANIHDRKLTTSGS